MVKLKVPPAVGVPLITPEEAFRANPGGNPPPVSVQEYGPAPPEAESVNEYAVPAVAPGSAAGLPSEIPRPTTTENCFWAVTDALSITVAVKAKVPAVVGVPVSEPAEPSSAMPGGTAPSVIDH